MRAGDVTVRRALGMAALCGAALTAAILGRAKESDAIQAPTMVRGNPPGEWRYWGADQWGTHYSLARQITPQNFDSLQVAWEWSARSLGSDEYYRTTPLYAVGGDGKGRLFTVATTRRIAAAIDPATGTTLWTYRLDEGIRWQKAPRQFAGRGLTYWTDGRGSERIINVTPGYHMMSLDARTGAPDRAFGKDGVVDLMDGLGYTLVPLAVNDSGPLLISDGNPLRAARPGETWDPVTRTGADGTIGIDGLKDGQIGSSSPPIVVNDVIIVGNSQINGHHPTKAHNTPGTIRGFDVHTGKQLWKFNLIPQPGEFGANTWENGSTVGMPGVGKNDAYGVYSADADLGLVYIPVGMPLGDESGELRPGDNLFGNSVLALDVKTGARKWHFQVIHHDIWDYDLNMEPVLMDVTVAGRARKVIAQASKQGFIYVLDRVTGEPIWPINEMPVGRSTIPGEKTSPTQPIPSRPEPYTQQALSERDIIDYTAAIKDSAMKLISRCETGLYYVPGVADDIPSPGGKSCVWYGPQTAGGVNVDGGVASDPSTGLFYIGSQTQAPTMIGGYKDPCSEMPYTDGFISCDQFGSFAPAPGCNVTMTLAGGGIPTPGLPGSGCSPTSQYGRPPVARGGGRGGGAGAGGGGGGGRAGGAGAPVPGAGRGAAPVVAAPVLTPEQAAACAGGGRPGALSIGGVSILKERKFGGVKAYDMKSGDVAWWIPNGGIMCPVTSTDPLFAGITLPPRPSGQGQTQAGIITTPTLLIYGTGRSGAGAPPAIYAVDKATGRQVGMVRVPTRNSADPMTFLHQGRQYIVFAAGSGNDTKLTALALPVASKR